MKGNTHFTDGVGGKFLFLANNLSKLAELVCPQSWDLDPVPGSKILLYHMLELNDCRKQFKFALGI